MSQATRPDGQSLMPAWARVFTDLRRQIEAGDFGEGEQLPTELEMTHIYSVSRITIRQAMSELAAAGLVRREQGKGSFVTPRPVPIVHDLNIAAPWRKRFAEAGHMAVSRVVEVDADPRVPMSLRRDVGLESDERNWRYFRRLHLVDSVIIGRTESWVDASTLPNRKRIDLLEGSLSTTLDKKFQLVPARSETYISVASIASADCEELETYAEAPAFCIHGVSYLRSNKILEVSRTIWLAGRVKLHFAS